MTAKFDVYVNTYRARPGLVIVRVEDGDRDGRAGGERHVRPGNVVDGVIAEVDPTDRTR